MKIKLENNTILIPTKAHEQDAGYDIYSPVDMLIAPHAISQRISLGVGFEVPKGWVGIISERSSQGKIGIETIGNIVDNGYTGNVHVTIVNNGDLFYQIKKGDRICQIYFTQVLNEPLEVVNNFEITERGTNAHGSSGK